MAIVVERITKDMLTNPHNIWLSSVDNASVLKSVTPVLADELNKGRQIKLFNLQKSYIAGAKYHPIKFRSTKKEQFLKVGDWLSLSYDRNNKHDQNAITYRIAASVFNPAFTDRVLKSHIFFKNKDGSVADILYGGSDSQYYITVGFVPQDHLFYIDNALRHYNHFYCPDIYANTQEKMLAKVTKSFENVAAKVVFVSKRDGYCNYYLDLFTAMSARKKYLQYQNNEKMARLWNWSKDQKSTSDPRQRTQDNTIYRNLAVKYRMFHLAKRKSRMHNYFWFKNQKQQINSIIPRPSFLPLNLNLVAE